MKIILHKPRPDISENVEERIDIELTDEAILLIGKRYLELASNPRRCKDEQTEIQ